MEYVLLAAGTAASILLLIFKLDLGKLLFFEIPLDIAITVALVIILAGTATGALVGLIAGGMVSIVLRITRKVRGYEKPYIHKWRLRWKHVEEI